MATPTTAEESPFLSTEPPPLAARGLAWILIALFVFTTIVAAVLKLPETIASPFVLIPIRGADPVRAPRSGTIAQVFAAEGHTVAKGAPLFAIRSDEFRNRLSEKTALESQLRGSTESQENARRKSEIEGRAAEEELHALRLRSSFLERVITLKRDQLALTLEQADRAKKLADQGIASLDDRSNALIRNSQAGMELEQLRADLHANESAIQRLLEQNAARKSTTAEAERTALEKAEQMRIRLVAAIPRSAPPESCRYPLPAMASFSA
jgi:multidrug efflux pump subunit AcrA (membrane-fusion protein)